MDNSKEVFNGYDHQSIETAIAKYWEENKIYSTPENVSPEDKYYILPQLPYPSGSGLHVGHAEVYSSCDIYSRYKRMQGKKVLQVIGWDAFGLPAENFAIKTNVHPRINTDKAIDNFREQIKRMGVSVDWDREVGSHNPDYYKWTQWFFKLMYDQGLAYRKKQSVNWCESCKTVLANEQVEEGMCERCDNSVIQKEMEQWYLKITEYADRLEKDLDKVDWPEETIKRQKDWIGKSTGAEIKFEVKDEESSHVDYLKVYTTAHDTIFGATFMVIAPEHILLQEYKNRILNINQVEEYIEKAKHKTELDRQIQKEKTGVKVEGLLCVNPINNKKIPIFVADYVLSSYGTGAIMAVPGHDERDFEFASKYDIDVIYLTEENEFISYSDTIKNKKSIFKLINSGEFNGMTFDKARPAILSKLEELGVGEAKTQYKLRDWSVSRQRFWGAPIPMLYKGDGIFSHEVLESYIGLPENVVQIHAWGSSPDEHFHQWLDKKLGTVGISSKVPEMAEALKPKFENWVETTSNKIVSDNNDVLIGRSLSTWSALKVAEKKKLRKLILIAPTFPTDEWKLNITNIIKDKEVGEAVLSFVFDNEIDFSQVQNNCGEIVFYLSTNDPYIPFEESEQYIKEKFPFARIVRLRDSGYFDGGSGYTTFPKLFDEILSPVRPTLVKAFDSDLPVILPDDVDFKPTGQSPLNYSPSFQEGVEEKYGGGWKREVDTLDTFMCSSWYYFRYLDPKNNEAFASQEALKKWMPVDFYIGGPEHVNGHLLYSRFFTKVLFDAGYIDFDEPFSYHRHQGMILGEDNKKMSKRWGNVINPTDVIEKYGADTLRMYEMFMGPLEQLKAWNDSSTQGVRRFLERVYRMSKKDLDIKKGGELGIEINKLIKKVTEDTQNLKFNTAVAEFMKYMNYAEKNDVSRDEFEKFILLLAPYAPFITDYIWRELFKNQTSIHLEKWPEYNKESFEGQKITIAVQFMGKTRGTIDINPDESENEVVAHISDLENFAKYLQDGYKKVIYIQGKIINFIV